MYNFFAVSTSWASTTIEVRQALESPDVDIIQIKKETKFMPSKHREFMQR